MRGIRSLLAVCLLLAARICPAGAQAALDFTLEVGEQRVLSAAHVASYSEGTPGVADIRLTRDGSSFVVVGLSAGRTSLLLMMDDGTQQQYRVEVREDARAARVANRPTAEAQRVEPRDNIRLDFYFVQLSRDDHSQIGIAWPAAFGGGSASAAFDLRAGELSDATAVIADQALPRLDLAQAQGWAKLLRQASVIAANGSQADFSGGGELNIPVQTALSVGMRQIAFGSDVKVQPRYDRESGRIELTIHAEVSDLSSDHGSGIPGRTLATLDSSVNLELGQSIVLAGLTARSDTHEQSGLAGLSQIPLIGPLFGSVAQRSEHTENLIVIVPSVVDAVSLEARERVREALVQWSRFDGDLEHVPLRRAPLSSKPGGSR